MGSAGEAGARAKLRRSLSLPLLTLYGLGTILGAGIYVLVGEVAGEAGKAAPLAFLLAGVVAGFTAFSYAELASRIPRSAGEAAYLLAAFRTRIPAAVAGWGVAMAGTLAASTVTVGFVGYFNQFIDLPAPVVIVAIVIVLGGLAAWGVGLSVGAASLVTLIEIVGLVLVCVLAAPEIFSGGGGEVAAPSEGGGFAWTGVFLGGFLAFFAYIGFEDIVNMAEESRDPTRTVPKAILISMTVATLLYMAVATVAVMAVPPSQLAGEEAPLVRVVASSGAWARTTIGLISMVAVINGALIQIIMVSRVIYGMAQQGLAPRAIGAVHPKRRTPLRATLMVAATVMILALCFPVVTLAEITSTVTLSVFALVNVALWKIKTGGAGGHEGFRVPLFVPVVGTLLSIAYLAANFWLH